MKSILEQLEPCTPGGYSPGGPRATEPTAWAAMALSRAGRNDSAGRAGEWLAALQSRDGSVGVGPDAAQPQWPTSLAILAWRRIDPTRFSAQIERAVAWTLASKGKPAPRNPKIGHDTTLIGWSWAADTHSWLEPTSFAAMSLRAAGYQDHPRSTEAVRMLVDRLLPTGGCNYGNTEILGQTLVPHLQPSGIVLWALAGEDANDERIGRSLEYLEGQLAKPTGCASLAYAIIALTAWQRRPANANGLIAEAVGRPDTKDSTYKLALLALAADEEFHE
ncbi:MAG: hypothetical protein ACR2NU_14890 [Aeoliella sp.]